MWKWLAIAATAYGLLGLGAVHVSPPSRPHEEVQDWQVMLRGLQLAPAPGMPPGPGPAPGMPQRPPGAKPPQVLDFEQQQPFFATRPEQQAEVVKVSERAHFLRWTPTPKPERFATLILPWHPAGRKAGMLTLRWRADRPTPVIIGLREKDGSVYSVERRAMRDWSELEIPLNELHRASRFTDENNQIDIDQVRELILVYFSRREDRTTDAAAPNAIELDDIRLR